VESQLVVRMLSGRAALPTHLSTEITQLSVQLSDQLAKNRSNSQKPNLNVAPVKEKRIQESPESLQLMRCFLFL
jgi:hypothetical protein